MSAYFMRLGSHNCWWEECKAGSYLKLGYVQTPRELLDGNDWRSIEVLWLDLRRQSLEARGLDVSTAQLNATQDIREIRTFYEATDADVFVTVTAPDALNRRLLYACRPGPRNQIVWNGQGNALRPTLAGWKLLKVNGAAVTTRNAPDRLATYAKNFHRTISRALTDPETISLLAKNNI